MTEQISPIPNTSLSDRAYHIRRNAVRMGEVQGQGYIAQALDIADVLAVAYFHAMRWRAEDPTWEGRDRFLLSNGHYAIALYAALIEAGIIPEAELESYGSDDSRLPMSGMASYTPGMEMSGGSLGLGLSIAVGMCLGLNRKKSNARVYTLFSDGELDEGSKWEAIMSAAHHKLDNLIAIVDVNNQQADGASSQVMAFEPLADKMNAFGWYTQRIDGNDLDAVVKAFDAAKTHPEPKPRMIIADTLMGKGVPFLEAREKNHFIRVDAQEWQLALKALDDTRSARLSAGEPERASNELEGQMKKPATATPTAKPRLTTSAMIASIAGEGQKTKSAPFGNALVELARSRPDIVGMTADLGKYTDLHIFAKEFPDRFYQMGMAEQLLFGAASGLAAEGFTPFATTYAVFASRRAYDFIHQTIAEEDRNVKIVCALPGLTSGYGPSHQAAEDLALFRAMPNMTVIDPCDAHEIEQAVPAIAAHNGPVYMRLLRGQVPLVLDEYGYTFELGKAKLLRDGADVLVIASGLLTMRTLEAAKALEKDRIGVAVLHVPTIKPLDTETIIAQCRRAGRLVVVAENHTIIGGLGEAVAGVLMRSSVHPAFRQIALPDEFLAAGALPTLHDRYGISTTAITAQIKAEL